MKNILLLVTAAMLTGCVTPQPKEPAKITLKQAMIDISGALRGFENADKDKKRVYGLVPSEIEVNFNISVDETNKDETSLTLAPTSMLNIGSTWSGQVVSKRGNQITIKFRNILFAKKDEAVYSTNIKEKLKELKDANISHKNIQFQFQR